VTGPSNEQRSLATLARLVLVLSVVVGVTPAGVAVWGLLQVRAQQSGTTPDVPLQDSTAVVAMTEGTRHTVYVDGPSLDRARCTVTGPDGAVQTLEGYDVVGRPPLGRRVLGDVTAERSGEHRVECTGVQEASVGEATAGGVAPIVPVLAAIFLVVGVLPVAVVALVVWRRSRRP
jgi:hypothetical protein